MKGIERKGISTAGDMGVMLLMSLLCLTLGGATQVCTFTCSFLLFFYGLKSQKSLGLNPSKYNQKRICAMCYNTTFRFFPLISLHVKEFMKVGSPKNGKFRIRNWKKKVLIYTWIEIGMNSENLMTSKYMAWVTFFYVANWGGHTANHCFTTVDPEVFQKTQKS